MTANVWFESWGGLVRVLLVGVVAYAALVILLRVSGKRTLSKLNAFDLVVTMALGSTLATIVLSKDVALAEGVAAFAVLIAGQFAVAWLSVRWPALRKMVKSEPRVLLWRGELLEQAMRRERVTREEVTSVVRGAGLASLAEAQAVILETDGSFHVLARLGEDRSALHGVKGARE